MAVAAVPDKEAVAVSAGIADQWLSWSAGYTHQGCFDIPVVVVDIYLLAASVDGAVDEERHLAVEGKMCGEVVAERLLVEEGMRVVPASAASSELVGQVAEVQNVDVSV
jgi:hypothetical protein